MCGGVAIASRNARFWPCCHFDGHWTWIVLWLSSWASRVGWTRCNVAGQNRLPRPTSNFRCHAVITFKQQGISLRDKFRGVRRGTNNILKCLSNSFLFHINFFVIPLEASILLPSTPSLYAHLYMSIWFLLHPLIS